MYFWNKISTCTSAEQSTMESQFNIVLSTLNRTSGQCSEKKNCSWNLKYTDSSQSLTKQDTVEQEIIKFFSQFQCINSFQLPNDST